MKYKPVNINHNVKVKLTQWGKNILIERHDELYESIGIKHEYVPPKEDKDGYSIFQMWTLMEIFGNSLFNGCHIPFETEILVGLEE